MRQSIKSRDRKSAKPTDEKGKKTEKGKAPGPLEAARYLPTNHPNLPSPLPLPLIAAQ